MVAIAKIDKELVIKKYLHGQTYTEIADELKISVSSVYKKIRDCKRGVAKVGNGKKVREFTDAERKRICAAYACETTLKELADIYHCSSKRIKQVIEESKPNGKTI